MNEWKKFNEDIKQVIKEPTRKQKFQMDDLHLTLYEFNQEKVSLSKSLDEVNKKIDRYMKELDQLLTSDSPPAWAWRWVFKKIKHQMEKRIH